MLEIIQPKNMIPTKMVIFMRCYLLIIMPVTDPSFQYLVNQMIQLLNGLTTNIIEWRLSE
jgi:hypothetical protein